MRSCRFRASEAVECRSLWTAIFMSREVPSYVWVARGLSPLSVFLFFIMRVDRMVAVLRVDRVLLVILLFLMAGCSGEVSINIPNKLKSEAEFKTALYRLRGDQEDLVKAIIIDKHPEIVSETKKQARFLKKKYLKEFLFRACEKENPQACMYLAKKYERGDSASHIVKNQFVALKYYLKSCQMGDASACYSASMLVDGERNAVRLKEKACTLNNGYAKACLHLAKDKIEKGRARSAMRFAKQACQVSKSLDSCKVLSNLAGRKKSNYPKLLKSCKRGKWYACKAVSILDDNKTFKLGNLGRKTCKKYKIAEACMYALADLYAKKLNKRSITDAEKRMLERFAYYACMEGEGGGCAIVWRMLKKTNKKNGFFGEHRSYIDAYKNYMMSKENLFGAFACRLGNDDACVNIGLRLLDYLRYGEESLLIDNEIADGGANAKVDEKDVEVVRSAVKYFSGYGCMRNDYKSCKLYVKSLSEFAL